MKKISFILSVLTCLLLASCVEPTANFDYTFEPNNNALNLPTNLTYNQLKIKNQSINATDYFWEAGNGNTSTDKEPTFIYDKSGEYTIKLTAKSKDGRTDTYTKNVKILDRVLDKMIVTSLNWNSLNQLPNWDDNQKGNVFIEIIEQESFKFWDINSNDNGKVVFTSPITQTISPSDLPVSVRIDERFALDWIKFNGSGLVFNIYCKYQGEKYILSSSAISGSGYGGGYDSADNYPLIHFGFNGSNAYLKLKYN